MGLFDTLKKVAKVAIPVGAAVATGGALAPALGPALASAGTFLNSTAGSALVGPAIKAGASLVGGYADNRAASSQAQYQNYLNEEQYERSRSDTLSDYNMQRDDAWTDHRRTAKFDRNQNKIAQRELDQNQAKWIRQGALKAGFNPLTLLGKGGTAAGVSGSPLGTPLANVTPAQPLAPPSANGLGNAARAVADGVSQWVDPVIRESQVLENELTQARIDQIQNEQTRLGQVPQVRTTASPVEENKTGHISGPKTTSQRPLQHWTKEKTVNAWLLDGRKVAIPLSVARANNIENSDTIDAGKMTQILGEVTGEVYNTMNYGNAAERLLKMGIFSGRDITQDEFKRLEKRDIQEENWTDNSISP